MPLQNRVVMKAVLAPKFSQSKSPFVLDSISVNVAFLYVAIYPKDWEGSKNYLEGWNLLTASMDYIVPSPYLRAGRHSPNPFPSRPINLLLLLSFTSCDSTETLKERVQQNQPPDFPVLPGKVQTNGNSKTFLCLSFPVSHNLIFHRDAAHTGCK